MRLFSCLQIACGCHACCYNIVLTFGEEKIMRTSLRQVGNSRGIIIPAALLAACEMGDEVDIRLEGKSLVIASVKLPRTGWFAAYQAEADSEPLAALPVDEGCEEWVW
jgi:antitoxin MazE